MTKRLLHVAADATLPLEVIQDSTTIFGRKRVGKSNDAAVIVEEALDLRDQVIVIDPKGDWWGITSSADGKHEGYPVVIIGGKHATLPLNPYAGAAVADWVIKTGYSVILDLSQLDRHDIERFCSAFLGRIRQHKVDDPGHVLIVIDEADELAPEDQRDRIEVINTYRAVVWMVKRGGFAGIATLVITQRPASLSKNVTTQSETIITLQVTGSQDLDAISDALKHHAPGATKKERTAALEDLLREIVKLDKGATVIVSAAPGLKGHITRIAFRRRRTFDSGATPDFSGKRRAPKVVAKVALAQLSAEMENAVAEVKANDPQTLRARIAELEAEVKKKPTATPAPAVPAKQIPVLRAKDIGRLERVLKSFDNLTSRFSGVEHDMGEAVRPVYNAIKQVLDARSGAPTAAGGTTVGGPVRAGHSENPGGSGPSRPQPAAPASGSVARTASSAPARAVTSNGGLTPAKQTILDTLAWFASIGITRVRREAVAGLAGVSPTSGTYSVNLSGLNASGLIGYPDPGHVQLTPSGIAWANAPAAPLTVGTLQAAIIEKVGGSRGAILRELTRIYPEEIGRVELAERIGVRPTSGTYSVNLSDLVGFGFIRYPKPKHVAAAPVLFMEAA